MHTYIHTCIHTHTHTNPPLPPPLKHTHLLGHVLSEAFEGRFLAGEQPHHLLDLPGTPAHPVVGLLQERVGARL